MRYFPIYFLLFAGCGQAAQPLEGSVTYRGKPVEGFVTFFPTHDSGASIGRPVVGGRYRIDELRPGTYRVLVSVPAKADATGKKLLPTIEVPAKAPGNDRQHVVTAGQTELHLAID